MAGVYVTRALPGDALERLREAGHDVRVHAGDMPPTRAELLAGVADADGLLSLLTERIDAEVLAAAPRLRAIANYAVGMRQRRPRGRGGARHPGRRHARRADRRDRGPRDRAAARRGAPPARRPSAPSARAAGARSSRAAGSGSSCAAPASRSSGRAGSARRSRERAAAFGMEVELVGRGDDLARRARPRRRRLAPLPADRGDAPPDRRACARGDEAERDPRQHRARPDRRPGGARRRAARRRDRRRRARRHRPRAAARRTTRCSARPTSSCFPTSARRRTPRASGWPRSPSTTCSPRSPASRCRTRLRTPPETKEAALGRRLPARAHETGRGTCSWARATRC